MIKAQGNVLYKFKDYDDAVRIGQGAEGIVFKVVHKHTKRKFALKTITDEDKSKLKEIEKTYRLLIGNCKHPNLIQTREVFQDDEDRLNIVMELAS